MKMFLGGQEYDYIVYDPDLDNPKASEAIRVVFPEISCVFKMFDIDQKELWSMKFWKGDLETVASYWRMVKTDRKLTIAEADKINVAFNTARSILAK